MVFNTFLSSSSISFLQLAFRLPALQASLQIYWTSGPWPPTTKGATLEGESGIRKEHRNQLNVSSCRNPCSALDHNIPHFTTLTDAGAVAVDE